MIPITFIPGDGIGPEVSHAAKRVLLATGLLLQFDEQPAGQHMLEKTGQLIPDSVFASFEQHRIALKGPITTPIGKGFRSLNVELRKKYDLFANVRPIKSLTNTLSRYPDVDLVIFRENTEDLYAGLEEMISEDEAHSIKVITRPKSKRIAEAAFIYARANKRMKVAIVTKANIMKFTDGLFLEVCKEVAKNYPDIEVQEVLVDNMCMQLVMHPAQYDVILTENLYGDILSDLGAGLVGGLGMVPAANIGLQGAIFEAVHGSAPDIAGQNRANPTAMMLSGAMLLDHIHQHEHAEKIRQSVIRVLHKSEILTRDLGGNASTSEFCDAVIHEMEK